MIALLAAAAMAGGIQSVPLDPERWETQGPVAFETREGRPAMRLGAPATGKRSGGVANVKGLDFATGVIEFDMLLPDAMEFSGPMFHQPDERTGEFIYFRPHMNGKPDAIQYTPVVNGNLGWQIFSGPGFEAEAVFPVGRWMRVRLDVYPASASVSVDGKRVLAIPDLKNGLMAGQIGFASLMGGTFFSNVSVQPIDGYSDPAPPPPAAVLPDGAVESFEVSEALTQAEAYDRASRQHWSGIPWHRIAAETNGIANLSKAGPDGEDKHSFIARFELSSPAARTVPMQFAFSDDVRIYLNGRPIYEGSDRQGSRDYRFLGHAGFWDSAFLELKEGVNRVALVVTDPTNGGTAAGAIIGR